MNLSKMLASGVVAGVTLMTCSVRAETISWLGTRTATNNSISPEKDWFVASNWDLGRIPQEGDDVVITNSVTASLYYINLTNSTPHLKSLTMRHNSPSGSPHYRVYLTTRNWMTCVHADTFHIKMGAQIMCPGSFTNSEMSNRVWCVGETMTLDCYDNGAGGVWGKDGGLYADKGGYAGRNGPGYACYPETGASGNFCGSYGGASVNTTTTGVPQPYGSAEWPFDPGTGGGGNGAESSAGGAIFVDLTGDLTINGTISARSGTHNGGCPGSGGGIVVKCRSIKGSGIITASPLAETWGGTYMNAAGGRIAVHYDPTAQAAVMSACKVKLWALPGSRGIGTTEPKSNRIVSHAGTVWLTDDLFWTSQRPYSVAGVLANAAFTSPIVLEGDLIMDGALITFTNAVSLKITGNVTSTGSTIGYSCQYGFDFEENSDFEIGGNLDVQRAIVKFRKGGDFRVGGDLTLLNKVNDCYYCNGELEMCTSAEGEVGEIASTVTVGGTLTLNRWTTMTLRSDDTYGTVPKVTANDIAVSNTAYVSASRYGYAIGKGPGFKSGCGSSHGGLGGPTNGTSAAVYGNKLFPTTPGSGGAPGSGYGGGVVYLEAARSMTINGTIGADGSDTSAVGQSSYHAAAGGSILLLSKYFNSETGVFTAKGGWACGGGGIAWGGGGGRIAIRTAHDYSDHAALTLTVAGGTSGTQSIIGSRDPAEDGTIFWGLWRRGLMMLVR